MQRAREFPCARPLTAVAVGALAHKKTAKPEGAGGFFVGKLPICIGNPPADPAN
jgi:hypothetical protein